MIYATNDKDFVNKLREIYTHEYKLHEWELAEIKHQSHFIPYGVDWKSYFDCYPFNYLFSMREE